jgi:hypothetical protein
LAAAPSGPETRPRELASAVSMSSVSSTWLGRMRSVAPVLRGAGRWSSQVSSIVSVPSQRMIARWMTFCSSRMLPGQSYASSSAIVLRLMSVIFLPAFLAYLPAKYSTSSGMSSARSRNDGT